MDSLEFGAFFTPYLICLIIEIIFLAKLFKTLDKIEP